LPQVVKHSPFRLSWRPLQLLACHQRPVSAMQQWLSDSGSLTARLIELTGNGNFRVQVLRQIIGIPSLSERKILGMRKPQLALIREVVLMGNNQPWVFARSLLPLTSLTGSLRHLRKQTTRPLGAFLFSQPQLTRSTIAVAQISRDHDYLPEPLIADQLLWGRRSVFYVAQKPLLVSEVFLPALKTKIEGEAIDSSLPEP
jgi:chorismate lyase